jgi:hypothetical protein
MLKIIFALLFFQTGFFKATYTGHTSSWTDMKDGEERPTPLIKIFWKESLDSSHAEICTTELDSGRKDTIIVTRGSRHRWDLVRWNAHPTRQPMGGVHIDQSNDSIKISMGFGYSGVSYYGRRDSL